MDNYKKGDSVEVDMAKGTITIAGKAYTFNALPDKLMNIFKAKGLVNYVKGA